MFLWFWTFNLGVPNLIMSCQHLHLSLDDLFGLKRTFQFTHIYPLMAYMIFQDRFCPPCQSASGKPLDSFRSVFGAESWLEGLRQKG